MTSPRIATPAAGQEENDRFDKALEDTARELDEAAGEMFRQEEIQQGLQDDTRDDAW